MRLGRLKRLLQRSRFQFTHPGGVRPTSQRGHCPADCFNSRTREGCDKEAKNSGLVSSLFQFTHPGGVRLHIFPELREYLRVSIHAPGRGATGRPTQRIRQKQVSIHAPGRGATAYIGVVYWLIVFQFTHPGGVRRRTKLRGR